MINFRLDRFLTLHIFGHITKKKSSSGNRQIPILMYHSISDEEEKSHPYYHVNTSPSVFHAHMSYLHENNYSVINLQDLENKFLQRDSGEYVVITFDDGFYDFFTNAFPILKKYNFSATVFLPTEFIHNKRLSFQSKDCMTWNEVRHMQNSGIHFGSHTVTHPQLKNLYIKEIENEVKLSKTKIEDETGVPVQSFSYPFALPENSDFIRTMRKILLETGYENGVSTRIGTTDRNDDNIFRKRIPMNTQDDLLLFKAKLEGNYNWLYKVQKLFKILKHNFLTGKKNDC